MFQDELKGVQHKINGLHKHGKLKNKDIFLFGVSDSTRQVIQFLRMLGYEPVSVIDNDPVKQNGYCARLSVVPLEKVPVKENVIIFIYSSFWCEMERQAGEAGFKAAQIIILFALEKPFHRRLYESWLGKKVYMRLKQKYGDVTMFLCPYTGTGDIYLIGTFWEEYISRNHIEEYVFLVISGACKKVASLFNIKNVELLNIQKESEYLIRYYSLCPSEIRLKLLNDGWGQISSNPSEWFRGYKGLYFTELFRKFVFDLPDTSRPRHPQFQDVSDQLNSLFKKYKLINKRTVVISPYSNTLADLPDEFWIKITEALLEKGYTVCTNSIGEEEPAVAGSIPVFFPLDIAPQFVERAGAFIGVRSGFCDVISGAEAKKIILYDRENRFYNCSAFEYFSLNRMGLCFDAIEIEYDHDKLEEVVSKIIANF